MTALDKAKLLEWIEGEICSIEVAGNALQIMLKLKGQIESGAFDLPTWISVEERLPEVGHVIVAHALKGWRRPAWYDGCVFRVTSTGGYLGEITHWQPLPKPPGEGEG